MTDFDDTVMPLVPELRRAAARLTRSHSEADDLTQETVIRAWQFWSRFDASGSARAWLHRILFNTFISSVRRKKRERVVTTSVIDEVAVEDSSVAREDDVFGDEVTAALSTLPEDFREVVLSVDVDALTYREAADAIGCPLGTVMSRLHRGRRDLRRSLEKYAGTLGYGIAA